MTDRGFKIAALGEVAIRCADFDVMTAFYRDILGLSVLAKREPGIMFFEISQGHAGHTCVLALFDGAAFDGSPIQGAGDAVRSTLHHVALTISAEELDATRSWLDAHGIAWKNQHFDWIGWTGVFVKDPEGNTVELVAATAPSEVRLLKVALAARQNAYAPYSKFLVGAAIRTPSGIFGGCNVENAAYPQGTCAEAGALAAMAMTGERTVLEVLVVADSEEPVTPCGGCRQKLAEFAAPDTPILLADLGGVRQRTQMGTLFPSSFHSGHILGELP